MFTPDQKAPATFTMKSRRREIRLQFRLLAPVKQSAGLGAWLLLGYKNPRSPLGLPALNHSLFLCALYSITDSFCRTIALPSGGGWLRSLKLSQS